MGLHRDGSLWRLEYEIAEERRKVFWECNAADIFQVSNSWGRRMTKKAHCFSRP